MQKGRSCGLSVSKKLACGDLFRQKLSVLFSAKLKTPRPTGCCARRSLTGPFADRRSAGRYEYSQRGCRPSDNSPEEFFDRYCCGLRREAGLFTKRVRSAEGREQRRSRSSAPVFIHFPQLSRYTRAS